jgi:putative nucleotidyltransferase with HDIG domain
MAVPDLQTARALLAEHALPNGVVVHSEGVRRVAVAAAGLIVEAGIPLDGRLVEAAALLHDIDKPRIRREGGEHGVVGARILTDAGFEELAIPVASHPLHALLDDARFPIGWPSVLVAVADRHVAQAFVTVDERLDDMKARHPGFAEQIEAARRPAHALEEQVAEVVGLEPAALVERLRAAWRVGAADG